MTSRNLNINWCLWHLRVWWTCSTNAHHKSIIETREVLTRFVLMIVKRDFFCKLSLFWCQLIRNIAILQRNTQYSTCLYLVKEKWSYFAFCGSPYRHYYKHMNALFNGYELCCICVQHIRFSTFSTKYKAVQQQWKKMCWTKKYDKITLILYSVSLTTLFYKHNLHPWWICQGPLGKHLF